VRAVAEEELKKLNAADEGYKRRAKASVLSEQSPTRRQDRPKNQNYGEVEAFLSGSKWGYVHSGTRKVVVPPIYDSASGFNEHGLAQVGVDEGFWSRKMRYGFIDVNGSVVLPLDQDECDYFSEGLVWAHRPDLRWACFDTAGKLVIKRMTLPMFPDRLFSLNHRPSDFSEGLASFSFGEVVGGAGYIDRLGNAVLFDTHWVEAKPFKDGWGRVSFDHTRWFRVNRKGDLFQD
jgi:hypothetical protein